MHIPKRLRRDPHTNRKGMPFSPQVVSGMRAIGRTVRAARHRAGLRQTDLERRSGLDQTIISRIENGKLDSLAWWRFASLVGALGDAWDPPRLEQNAAGGWELPADLRASLLLFLEDDVGLERDQSEPDDLTSICKEHAYAGEGDRQRAAAEKVIGNGPRPRR